MTASSAICGTRDLAVRAGQLQLRLHWAWEDAWNSETNNKFPYSNLLRALTIRCTGSPTTDAGEDTRYQLCSIRILLEHHTSHATHTHSIRHRTRIKTWHASRHATTALPSKWCTLPRLDGSREKRRLCARYMRTALSRHRFIFTVTS